MKKDILNKMSAEALSQMAVNPDISENFSKGLKDKFLKLGSVAVLAGLMTLTTGMQEAHASDNGARNAVMSLSGLFGLVNSGKTPRDIPIDCNVEGTSGMKVGGAGMLGAYAGSQVGGGNGKILATVAGGMLGAGAAQSAEEERMRRECARQISQSQRNSDSYGMPRYATNNSSPQSPILYEGRTADNRSFYVTMKDSPGIAGLSGRIIGNQDVNSDPIVRNAMEKGSDLLAAAYRQLDVTAQEYVKVMRGGTTVAKLSRYAVDDNDVAPNSQLNREQQMRLYNAKRDLDEAYSEYSRRRSVFANVADNAVVDGFNISQYGRALDYFTPPESVTMTYNGKLPNRYAMVPTAARPN